MQIRYIATSLLVLTAAACTQSITERAEKDQMFNVPGEEPAMRQAMERAQATLDDFLIRAKHPAEGTSAYALKVAIREGRDTEYFWVNEFSWSDGSFTGRINNEPRLVKSVKLGELYKFTRSQIVDWTYIDEKSGRTLGNFTACARLSMEPPTPADEFERRRGLACQ